MKKIAALVLALCLAFSMACAEETAIEWNDDTAKAFEKAGYSGEFFGMGDFGIEFMLPSNLKEAEMTEEDEEKEIFLKYEADDGMTLEVSYTEGDASLFDSFVEMFKDEGKTDAAIGTINGFTVLGYSDNNGASQTAIVDTGIELLLTFTFNGITEGNSSLPSFVFASIRPMSEE